MKAGPGASTVGRKKSGLGPKTTSVKIDTRLIRKAKTIAEDKGLDLAEYLSDAVRVAVDRDWTKVLKKIVEAEGGEK
jgi:hypothetical protein